MEQSGPQSSNEQPRLGPVFVSYATADRKEALSVCESLERRGTGCWFATRDVSPGGNYQEEIVKAIRSARAMVLVFSQAANNSDEIKKELSLASRHRIPVMALRIEDVEPGDAFAYELSTRQWLDAFAGWERSIDALVSQLEQITSKAGPANPSPQAVRQHRPRPRKYAAAIAVSAIALLALATLAWLLLRPSSPTTSGTQVRLAALELLSPDLPAAMPDALRDELLAAFGDDGVIDASTATSSSQADASGYALGATIRREGQTIKIIVRLRSERSGTTVWSDTFSHDLNLADRIPRKVAVKTALVVRCGLFGASTYPRKLPDAVLADYFQVCQNTGFNQQATAKALDYARKVVAEIPDFSWGWSAVGNAIVAMQFDSNAAPVTDELRQEALKAIDKAIQLDRSNSQAFADKNYLIDSGDLLRREELLQQALKARQLPCACEHLFYGYMLEEVGRFDDAIVEFRRSTDVLPLVPFAHVELAHLLTANGQREAAKSHLDAAAELGDDPAFDLVVATIAAVLARDLAKARGLVSKPDYPATSEQKAVLNKALSAILSGKPATKARAAALLTDIPAPKRGRVLTALLGELGANSDALASVEAAVSAGEVGARDVLYWPSLAAARADPAFPAVAQRLGLLAYWRQSKKRPDFCAAKAPPPVCRMI